MGEEGFGNEAAGSGWLTEDRGRHVQATGVAVTGYL